MTTAQFEPTPPLTCPGPDRRRWPRTDLHTTITVTELDRKGQPSGSWTCTTLNISRGGLAISSRRMVHEDRHLLVEFPAGPKRPPRRLGGVVRHNRCDQGRYIIGIEFEPVPSPVPSH